jgi:hypothetical protein
MVNANPSLLSGNVGNVIKANVNRLGGGSIANPGAQGPTGPANPASGTMSGMISALPPAPNLQPTPLPSMPQGFGQPTGPTPPAPQVNNAGHQGDSSLMMGLGMLSGQGWANGFKGALQGYQAANEQQQSNNRLNAQLQSTNNAQALQAPVDAAQAAASRANAWRLMNPGVVTPQEAANVSLTARGQDAQMAERAMMQQLYFGRLKQNNVMVAPGPDGVTPQFYNQQVNNAGQVILTDQTGQPVKVAPAGLEPLSAYKAPGPEVAANIKQNTKDLSSFQSAAQGANLQHERFQTSLAALTQPGANVTPGIYGDIGRGIDSYLGTNLFGNLSDTQITQRMLQQDMLGQIAKNKSGRMTDAFRSMIVQANAHLGQDPQAIQRLVGFLDQQNGYTSQVADMWNNMTPAAKSNIMRNQSFSGWVTSQQKDLMSKTTANGVVPGVASPGGASGGLQVPGTSAAGKPLPPLSSYWRSPGAPVAPSGSPNDGPPPQPNYGTPPILPMQ